MKRSAILASLVMAVGLSLSMAACKDTKTLQENEQLKGQVADLQRQNGQLGNNIESLTANLDTLKKQNEALEARLKPRKVKHSGKKTSNRKRSHT